ncbi:MAG: hypothetical protein FWD70_03315, partial [Desulfuromonadales bacterium]|nr:hypothetical protein [Desulfuromonadales bacterium]
MNKIFKTVWSEASGTWVAVAEITKAYKTGRSRKRKLVAAAVLAAALGLSFSSAAYANLTIDTSAGNSPYSQSGASLDAGGILYVGYSNTGELNVTNGGTVSATYGYIGYNSGSGGTVAIDGTNSAWTTSTALVVGNFGTGTLSII